MTVCADPSPLFVALFNVGGTEIVVILVLVLILFGGEKMPELARGLGKALREFKKVSAGVEEELRKAMEEPPPKPKPAPAPIPGATPYSVPPPPSAPLAPSSTNADGLPPLPSDLPPPATPPSSTPPASEPKPEGGAPESPSSPGPR